MNILRTLIATAALLPVIASAQNPYHGNINERQAEQHKRIVQGIRSGQLTHREVRGLHNRTAVVRAQERRDRYFHHGHLTSHERTRLNHEMNHDSRSIYRQKHDAQVRHH